MNLGDHYFRGGDNLDLAIFGEVVESSHEEDRLFMVSRPDLVLVQGYSMICPGGEMGTEFVHMLLPISTSRFEEAKLRGWRVEIAEALEWAEKYEPCEPSS